MGREHLEIVVKHADYHSVQFGRSGTLCHEQVRPTMGIFDKYRKGFRDRAECSGSQRRHCRSRDRVQIEKVGTLENLVDMLTKFLTHDALSKHA